MTPTGDLVFTLVTEYFYTLLQAHTNHYTLWVLILSHLEKHTFKCTDPYVSKRSTYKAFEFSGVEYIRSIERRWHFNLFTLSMVIIDFIMMSQWILRNVFMNLIKKLITFTTVSHMSKHRKNVTNSQILKHR